MQRMMLLCVSVAEEQVPDVTAIAVLANEIHLSPSLQHGTVPQPQAELLLTAQHLLVPPITVSSNILSRSALAQTLRFRESFKIQRREKWVNKNTKISS